MGTHREPDELIAEIEEKQVLERALLELDDPYRSVLLWRYYENLPLACLIHEDLRQGAGADF